MIRVGADRNAWPEGFSTYCTSVFGVCNPYVSFRWRCNCGCCCCHCWESGCSCLRLTLGDGFRWSLNGTFISSGYNKGYPDVRSTLQWSLELARAGTIEFSYRVDAEIGIDGLTFLVDGVAWPAGLVSYQFDFATYSVRRRITTAAASRGVTHETHVRVLGACVCRRRCRAAIICCSGCTARTPPLIWVRTPRSCSPSR